MLLGEYEHTIDDKNRLTLPAKFRKAFTDGVVLTRGMDGCLYAYPRREWERLETRIAALDPLSHEGRRLQRFFFSGAFETDLDRQGRVMGPAALSRRAGLGRDVVVAGLRDHLEIWDRTAWGKELTEVEGSAEDVAQRLANGRE
jgi:MraZ protein